jgi:hypothetical protein
MCGHRHGAQSVASGLCCVGRDTVRNGFGHPVAVGGGADAAEDRDGERPTK